MKNHAESTEKDKWRQPFYSVAAAATKEELAWLAGLIDGEGCVSNAPSIRINLVERDKFVLEKVQQIAGCGNLNFRPLHAKNPNWNNQWVWNLYKTKDVITLSKKLLPYLVLKKKAVELMLGSVEERLKLKYGIG